MLGKPKFPEKGHRWFYYFWFGGWFTLLIVYIAMLLTNIAILQSEDPLFGISIFHGIFAAAIVEEIIFRGYLYARCEDIFGKNRHYIVWTRQEYDKEGISTERPFMTFEITYAALLSSFIFGIYHLNPIQLIITFFGGLFFCKFRNEWESLIPGMIFHAMWNSIFILLLYTEFNIPLGIPYL